MKQVVMCWGLVLVLVSVAGAGEADKKMGALIDGMGAITLSPKA